MGKLVALSRLLSMGALALGLGICLAMDNNRVQCRLYISRARGLSRVVISHLMLSPLLPSCRILASEM